MTPCFDLSGSYPLLTDTGDRYTNYNNLQDGRMLSGTVAGALIALTGAISSSNNIMRLYLERRLNRHVHMREVVPTPSQLRLVSRTLDPQVSSPALCLTNF